MNNTFSVDNESFFCKIIVLLVNVRHLRKALRAREILFRLLPLHGSITAIHLNKNLCSSQFYHGSLQATQANDIFCMNYFLIIVYK